MLYPQNFLDELRNRVSVAEIVGRTVKLTRKGREYAGLCPFHSEKTPSFTVSEEKAFYHCFGCGAHGDAIKFVMQTQNMSFSEAVQMLAEQAGLELPKSNASPRSDAEQARRQQLLNASAAAQNWFVSQLGGEALQYLQKRGLSMDTIRRFGLGFAPDSRDGLRQVLLKAGYAENILVDAGLLIKTEDRGNYDRFRGRVMFPIQNSKGSAIAFGGRILGVGEPKYLNSSESEIFHKGHTLYALNFASAAAGKARSIIVVEGYMDAIALHQAGIENTVANLGTALTEHHIQLLWRYADKILLCFDGDTAGQRAAARAMERALPLLRVGKEVRFVTIPPGYDPDTYVQTYGKEAFLALCAKAAPFHQKLLDIELSAKPIDTPESKADFYRRLRHHLSQIKDQILRGEYRETLYARIRNLFAPPAAAPNMKMQKRRGTPVALLKNPDAARRKEAEALLAACIMYPQLLRDHAEDLGTLHMDDPDLEALRHRLIDLALTDAADNAEGYLPYLPGAMQALAESVCADSRRLYTWLRQEEGAAQKWQALVFAFRAQQDQGARHVAVETLLDEQGWENFLRQNRLQSEASAEIETALLQSGKK